MIYDELPVRDTSTSDLSRIALAEYFERFYGEPLEASGISYSRLLNNLKLTVTEAEDSPLTVGGLLLFGRQPQRFIPYAKVIAVRFEGDLETERIIDKEDFAGTLFTQIEDAERWLKVHLATPSVLAGFRRVDVPELPNFAVREALVNAIVHRDYSLASQVRIFLFDNRLEVRSPGRLPNTITIENIKLGIHAERNPVLVTYMAKAAQSFISIGAAVRGLTATKSSLQEFVSIGGIELYKIIIGGLAR